MKVLHITNWYRSKENPYKVPFVKEHFDALNLNTEGHIIHVEVQYSEKKFLKFTHEKISASEESYLLKTKIQKWYIIEWLSYFLLKYALLKTKYKSFNILNFHTGYPLLTRFPVPKKLGIPYLIIEHWTAFHYNFNLPKNTNKLDRIKNIYKRNIPLLTVSNQLKKDIEDFSGSTQNGFILPNVVDNKYFFYDEDITQDSGIIFFMVNYWRAIKSPFQIFKGFLEFLKGKPNAILRVGGYGPLWAEMEKFVEDNNLQNNLILLGALNKEAVGNEMRKATAFVHAADYETFSVVCAEAISCGCPVFVNELKAVGEFINAENGYLKPESENWSDTLNKAATLDYNRKLIAEEAKNKFNKKAVGEMYFKYNQEVISDYNN